MGGDFISRDLPIERIHRKLKEVYSYPKTDYAEGYVNACKAAVRMLEELPAADVRPSVPGHWIPREFPYPWYYPKCSVCGYEEKHDTRNFCQNCGADMRDRNE